MHPANPHVSRPTRLLSLGALVVAALLPAAGAVHAQYSTPPITVGLRYFVTVNSSNGLLADGRTEEGSTPLELLAAEAELSGHERLGEQVIDASTLLEHWTLGNGDERDNPAKTALRSGGVDVFMVSPGLSMPDAGIDRFADLMIETNPQGRILVQSAWWGPADGSDGAAGDVDPARLATSDGDRDAGWGAIQAWIEDLHSEGGYLERLRAQLMAINERAGSAIAYLVPAADAVYRLRQEAVLGRVPGIERQSDLFDPEGRAGTPIANLVSYVWFVAIYQQPADGLTALVDRDDPSSAARERLLQRIAWDVTFDEPMGGVEVGLLWPNGVRGKHELLHQMSREGRAHDSDHGSAPGR